MARRVIGTATVEVGADTGKFRSDIKSIGSQFASMTRSMGSGLSSAFGNIQSKIAGLGLGHLAKEAITFGAEYRMQLDNARAAVTGLTSSQAEADQLMRDMTQFAINTPFSLPGVQESVAQLLAVGKGFGVTAQNATNYAEVIGNVTAITGGNDDTMRRIVRTFGQMSSSGKVLGQDMNQLAQNIPGFDVWGALAEGTGKSREELRKLQDEGKLDELLTGNEAVGMLIEGMKKMPGAADAMTRKMNTLGGAVEMFKDTMGVATAAALTPFFDTLRGALGDPAIMKSLTDLSTVFGELASEIVTGLAPVLPQLIESFTQIVAALIPAAPAVGNLVQMLALGLAAIAPLISLLAQLVTWVTNLLMKLDPAILSVISAALLALWLVGFGPVGLVVAAIVALAVIIQKNWDTIVSATKAMVDAVVAAWDWLFDAVIAPIRDFVMAIVHWFQDLYNTLVGNSIIPDMVNAIIDWFGILIDFVTTIVEGIKTVVVAVWNAIKVAVEAVVKVIATVIEFYFNVYKTIITTYINVIRTVITTTWNAIKATLDGIWSAIKAAASLVWEGIKLVIINPITEAVNQVKQLVQSVRDTINTVWGGLKGIVSGIWNGVKNAITGPIQTAYNFVADKIGAIKNLVSGAIDAINKIPGAGVVKGVLSKVPGFARGGVGDFGTGTPAVLHGREAVIPMNNPLRAMQVMQQAGLDRLAAQMSKSNRSFDGPLVSMPGAIIQDATDADLVAQRTLAAMRAAMVA